jgi:hypothetical protein
MLLITGRPWRQVARELATERDPYRIIELSEELTAAVAAQRSVPERQRRKESSTAA